MSLLTPTQIKEAALAHGRIFQMVCDTPGCSRLIIPGDLYVVLKWKKREDGLQGMLGRIPSKIRCMTCERELHPPKEEVKVQNAGRGAKKVAPEVAAGITLNPVVRKIVMRLLKKGGIEKGLLISTLRRKKAVRELKAKEIRATIRGMRKLKMFRSKENMFVLPKEKKKKKVKNGS